MPTAQARTPVIISVDVEPVHRLVRGGTGDWDGFPELLDLLSDRRAALAAASGRPVQFSWHLRMDPQIELAYGDPGWIFARYGAEIDRIRATGDSVGIHVHTWRPARRFFRDTWLAEYQDEAWITRCISLAFDTFRTHVGAAPVSMSFGDSFMHACALPVMQEHGLRADLSMFPGMGPRKTVGKRELSNGRSPDYRVTPTRPFKPSANDFRVPGGPDHGFWEIPVTAGSVGRSRDGSDRWTKLLLGTNPDWVTALLDTAARDGATHLVAECRTDVLTHPKTRDRFIWAMNHLEDRAARGDYEFVSAGTLCDRLDAGDVAALP
jgi:hypothetical protein